MANKTKRRFIIQFAKYMVGGGVYFWSGYLIFALGYSVFHLNWLWAKIMADLVGWTLNFLIQRFWAFNHPELGGHTVKVTGRYAFITVLNLGLDYTIVASLKAVGVTPYLGMFISSGFFTVWNYLWYKLWVFSPKRLSRRSK
jgi:putative flippase GtrA